MLTKTSNDISKYLVSVLNIPRKKNTMHASYKFWKASKLKCNIIDVVQNKNICQYLYEKSMFSG